MADIAATLAEIRERRYRKGTAPGLMAGWLADRAAEDIPRLLKAVEDALKLADESIPAVGAAPADCTDACNSGPCDCSGETRPVAWTLDPAKLRAVFAAALAGADVPRT